MGEILEEIRSWCLETCWTLDWAADQLDKLFR